MKRPTEHKTVQARILANAHEIGWTYVPRAEAEARAGTYVLEAAGVLTQAMRELGGGLPEYLGKRAQEAI